MGDLNENPKSCSRRRITNVGAHVFSPVSYSHFKDDGRGGNSRGRRPRRGSYVVCLFKFPFDDPRNEISKKLYVSFKLKGFMLNNNGAWLESKKGVNAIVIRNSNLNDY